MQLVAPTSTDARLRLAADATDGWLYLVTVTGTTGARAELAPTLAPLAERARAGTDVPLYAGFGISTPEQARAAAELVDGIVVGSRAVEAAEAGPASSRGSSARCAARWTHSHAHSVSTIGSSLAAVSSAIVVGAGVFGAATARESSRSAAGT